jgi:hypothetical protein
VWDHIFAMAGETFRQSFPVFEESDFWLDISAVTMFVLYFYHTLLFSNLYSISGPQIGQGQFSKVYIGKYFGDYVAIKKQIRQEKVLDCYLLRELAVLKNAIHENLVGYFGACNEVATTETRLNALYIVTEFCQVSTDTCLLDLLIHVGWRSA